jgi:hypothetical protein
VVVPPVDHECVLSDVVAELSNEVAKLRHELAQLKKAHIGPKSERSKMPRVSAPATTAEERLAKRRANAADRAQTQTVRTEHKVPAEGRTCPACGNDQLGPIGDGRMTVVYEFVPGAVRPTRTRPGGAALSLRRIRHRAWGAQGHREGPLRGKPPRTLGSRKVCGPSAALSPREGFRSTGLAGTKKHLRAGPVRDELHRWLIQQQPLHPPKSPIAAAIRYVAEPVARARAIPRRRSRTAR